MAQVQQDHGEPSEVDVGKGLEGGSVQAGLLDGKVIGERPRGRFQRFFFQVDPFKQDEYVRNANVHTPKRDLSFAFLYWGILIGYLVHAFIQYANRPLVESYGQLPMTQAQPASLIVELECTTAWGCYNASEYYDGLGGAWWENEATNPNSLVNWIQIRHKYSKEGLEEGYCSDVPSFTETVKTRSAQTSQEITLCYSRDSSDGVDIVVPFPNSYEEGNSPNLNIRVVEGGKKVGMEVEVSLEASQVKTVTVGADIRREDGLEETQELFRADLFYNAKRPFNTGLLRIRLEHRAGVRTISRPGSILDVLASAGGASGFLLALIMGIRSFDPKSIASGGWDCLNQ